MTLPSINPSRLQRVVADLEFKTDFSDLTSLCDKVVETEWATALNLTADAVQQLIYANGTITKVDKPPKPAKDETIVTEVVVKEIKMFDEPAKGRKQCPACKRYVSGLRSLVCGCGHVFAIKAKAPVVETAAEPMPDAFHKTMLEPEIERDRPSEQYGHGYRSKTWVPAGECPHKLKSTERSDVQEWAESVRKSFENRHNSFLTLHGLKYWVNHFYSPFKPDHFSQNNDWQNPEFMLVIGHLDDIYPEDRLYEKDR